MRGSLCESDVLGDGEMREERRLLRSVRDAAIVRWRVSEVFLGAVFVGSNEFRFGVWEYTGDGAEDGALAAAGRAEDDRPVAGEVEVEVEREGSEIGAELETVMVREWRRSFRRRTRR